MGLEAGAPQDHPQKVCYGKGLIRRLHLVHGLNVRNKQVPVMGFSAEQLRRLLLAHAPKTPP
jgi:hypothetical protein